MAFRSPTAEADDSHHSSYAGSSRIAIDDADSPAVTHHPTGTEYITSSGGTTTAKPTAPTAPASATATPTTTTTAATESPATPTGCSPSPAPTDHSSMRLRRTHSPADAGLTEVERASERVG